MIGVYKILNKVNGKFYIGSSIDIEKRFKSHRTQLNRGIHNNTYLQNAWDKYGENNFDFLILEIVDDIDILRDRETHYLQTTKCTDHNVGYNLLNNANVGLGVSASKEVREKISKACSGTKNGNYGRKHTSQELERMYINRWGKDYKKKPRKPYQRKSIDEIKLSRKRQSEKMRGRVVTEETRQKIARSRLGTHATEETKAKYRAQRKGIKNANSKLTREQVFEIYEKMNNGVNYKDVCAEYGIGQCWAYKIKRKEHWAFNDEQ